MPTDPVNAGERTSTTGGTPVPRLPGPRAWFPGQLLFAFLKDPLGFLERNASQHGPVWGFRTRRAFFVVATEPEIVRDVLVTQADKFTKSPILQQAKITLGEGLLTSEGDFHKRQRRLSQPAFHPHRVATYADAMVRRARQTAGEWRDGQVIDLHDEMMKLTLRVVTETLFGASIDSELDAIGRSMTILVKMFDRARNPLAPLLNRLPLPSNRRFLNAQAHVRRTVEWFVLQRRMDGVDRGDLLSSLLRATDFTDAEKPQESRIAAGDGKCPAGGGMSDEQLRDELVTLFAAGHETTANALTFSLWLVARHPEVADRLHAEVDAVLDADRPATSADEDRLPYTRAVVAESMRLYPPAWTLMRQAKVATEIGPADGDSPRVAVPEKGLVILSQWLMHRDERWWPEPTVFRPERWLGESSSVDRPRYAYFPFGGGPRSCIGESFAWTEAILLLATLARRWKLSSVSDEPLRLLPTITLRPRGEVKMQVSAR